MRFLRTKWGDKHARTRCNDTVKGAKNIATGHHSHPDSFSTTVPATKSGKIRNDKKRRSRREPHNLSKRPVANAIRRAARAAPLASNNECRT